MNTIDSMEAHFITCKTTALRQKSERLASPPGLAALPPVKSPRSLLSRFGSQAQAFFSPKKQRFGSSVAIHKLRESKWFRHDEQGILCAVLESGFIVEIKADPQAGEVDEGLVAPDHHAYGVAMWKKGKEKSKNAEQIEIYTLNEKSARKRVYKTSLPSFWKRGTVIRIHNVADKQEQPNGEKDIRSKLDTVARSRHDRNWHNSLHFVHWCRYGETPEQARTRQQPLVSGHVADRSVEHRLRRCIPEGSQLAPTINETLKWGNVGMNMGVLLVAHGQPRRHLQTV